MRAAIVGFAFLAATVEANAGGNCRPTRPPAYKAAIGVPSTTCMTDTTIQTGRSAYVLDIRDNASKVRTPPKPRSANTYLVGGESWWRIYAS